MARPSTTAGPSHVQGWDIADRRLTIRWADDRQSVFHAIWLRDNCLCKECRHEVSGQRVLDTASIPADISIVSAQEVNGGAIEIVWTGDAHVGRFPITWLDACAQSLLSGDATAGHTLWDAGIAGSLPAASYDAVRSDDAALRTWLAAVDEYGFALLHGVPVEPGEILHVVELFGYVRETNYGRLFDVQSVVNPTNLAYTGLALGAHTDNPYRDPTPSLQLLHCLSSSALGGDSTLVDGFRVAHELSRTNWEAFDLLTLQPVQFRYRDETTDLSARVPIISVSPWGEITAIRFNNRSRGPLNIDAKLIDAFYDAHRTFARMLAEPRFEIRFSLEPGDLVIMDNLRVLHGRTGYSAAGERHLQGCYADRDGLRSRLAVLRRSTGDT